MARYDFGGTVPDFVFSTATVSGTASLLRLQGATLTFYSAKTGGTQYTDLRLASAPSTPVSTVTVGSDGVIPEFQGHDGVTSMWVTAGGPRIRIVTWTPGAGAAPGSAVDATSSTNGLVRLAGDLGGTATSPTVPGLAGKANGVHTHTSTQIGAGPVGVLSVQASTQSEGRSAIGAAAAADVAPIVGKPVVAAGTTQAAARASIDALGPGDVPFFDTASAADGYVATWDESANAVTFQPAGAAQGQEYQLLGKVMNVGDPIPADWPDGGILFARNP